VTELKSYIDMIAAMLATPTPFEATAESQTALQVERGLPFPALLAGAMDPSPPPRTFDRLMETVATPGRMPVSQIVDAAGHRRPAYRGLLTYAWLHADSFDKTGRCVDALHSWLIDLETRTRAIEFPSDAIPARDAGPVVAAGWQALALHHGGERFFNRQWVDLAADVFSRVVRAAQSDGAFFATTAADNLETAGYDELALLHAIASYAIQTKNMTMRAVVFHAAKRHMAETQPDHSSAEPWGLPAFLWNPATHPLADQLLHAHRIQQPGGSRGVASLLLGDALYCLRRLEGV
jgi:hypothetical protein